MEKDGEVVVWVEELGLEEPDDAMRTVFKRWL
jgi:hypothetical protein